MKYLIDGNQGKEFLARYNRLKGDIWRDYGVNVMTDAQWQKKYPGIPEHRAAGEQVEAWAFEETLKHFAKRIEA